VASLAIAKAGEHGIVTFTGSAGQKIFTSLTMSPSEATSGSVQLVQEPGGLVITSDSLTGSAGRIDTVTLSASGTYEVIADPVDGTGGYTGTMTIAVTSAPDQTGTTSVDGTPATVTLGKPGEQAVASFAGTAGQRVITRLSLSPSQCSGSHLVDTASGLTLALGTCGGSGVPYIDDTTLPDTGTYQVIVSPSGGYTGTVTVTVTSIPAAATAAGTYGGSAVTVSTTKPGQDGLVTFTAVPANASAEVNVTASSYPAAPEGWLIAPDGNMTFCGFLTVGTPCKATLVAAGSYGLAVDHNGPGTGSITVQLTTAPAGTSAHPAVSVPQPLWRPVMAAVPPALIAAPPAAPRAAVPALPRYRQGPPRWSYTAPVRSLPRAALTGTILTTAGKALPGVTVSVGARRARTDRSGHFRLTGLSQGMQVLEMDGRTASTPSQSFGVFDVQVRLRAGTGRLPFTSYFPVLDTAHEVSIPEPLAKPVTLTTPSIPGLAVHLPAGIRITDADGKPVYKVGITAIPVKRTPIPMPAGEQVPVYFTVQPAGGHIVGGWATIDYPNYHHVAPGTSVNFWHYDTHGTGWVIYGTGTVNASGTQVVPDKGTWITDFNGAMINVPGENKPNSSWLAKFLNFAGDPVDPGTGLYHMTQTDLSVNDVIPLALTRGYNPGDGNSRAFGNNSGDLYDTFLTHDQPEPSLYTEADLNLIDGGQVHFVRTTPGTTFSNAVMETQSASPQFFHATLSWNGKGWNLKLRDGTTLVYGENAPLQAIRDAHGNTVQIFRMFFNSFGNYDGPITNVVSPNGYWLAYTWETSVNPPRVAKVTDNAGRSVSYLYDSSGSLHTVTDPLGHVTTYGYDTANRLNSITDGSNIKYLANIYDANGRVSSQTITGQGTYQFSYAVTSTGTATQVTEPDGTVRDLTYDSGGYLASDQRAVGTSFAHTIGVARDSSAATGDLPGSVSDGLGRKVSTTYDGNGNERTNTYAFSDGSAVSASATYNGTPFGLPDSTTNPAGQTEHFTYDGGGSLTSVKDAMGNLGTANSDAQGNPKFVLSPLGSKTAYNYVGGQLLSATDSLGRITRYAYDQANRLVRVINPDGTGTQTSYDADNQVTATTDAAGNATRYIYDGNGNLVQAIDPKNNVTKYGHNDADQLKSVTDPLGNSDSSTYFSSGQLKSYTDRNGKETDYLYDPLGRLTFTGYNKNSSGGYESSLTYSYDPSTGNLDSIADTAAGAGTITYKYDSFDHVKSETGPGGTINYAYNPAGQLQSMTPPGQAAINYIYDADGRLHTETQGSLSASYTYDADGRLSAETMPDGITADYSYDAAGQLAGINYWEGASALVGNVAYSHDPGGRRVHEGGTLVKTVLPAAQSGNMYNADNELTSFGGTAYSYDPDGNLRSDGTNSYTWNARGQLASVTSPSGTSALGYDPVGRLISTSVGGVSTTFAYNGSELISQSGSDGTKAAFLNGPYGTLARTDNSTAGGGAVQAYLPDALNSTLALVNSAGQVATSYGYDVLGNTTSSAGATDPNPLRYTGLVSGSTMPAGLQDNNARDYSPATGQFISQDPTGSAGSGNNLYQYAGGDSVDNSDPSGLQWQLLLVACVLGGITNDVGGSADGRKHSFGDFVTGFAKGCVGGALFAIPGADEAAAAMEGADASLAGIDGSQDATSLADDLAGDGTAEETGGENACTTTPNSFEGGTAVELADGTTKPIDQLKPGDKVLATDPSTGKSQAEPVLAVIEGHGEKHLAKLTITTDARGRHQTGVIVATSNHPFWDVTRKAWIAAGSLHPGDHLYTPDHQSAVVAQIQQYTHPDTVYNLTIATTHTYYVSAAGESLLVHNANCSIPTGAPRDITGYTPHGLNQVISRNGHGVSVQALFDAVRNPAQVVGQSGGRFKYIGRNATVILNSAGRVITAWARNSSGWRYP
jgi:RHS repeat-associated protein